MNAQFRVWDSITNSYSGGDLWHLYSSGKLFYGNAEWPEGIIEMHTGLKDKNGVNIYEGDKVRCLDSYGEDYYESYISSDGAFSVDVVGCDYDYTSLIYAVDGDIEEIEVIGNIHEEVKKPNKTEDDYEW